MKGLVLIFAALLAIFAMACSDDDDGGDDDAPAATSPAAASETDESTPAPSSDGGGGTYTSSALPVSVTVSPGHGFIVPDDADDAEIFAVLQTGFPNGYVDFLQPTQVYTYTSETESEVGAPPDDYVEWFQAIPYIDVVATQDVTVGGLPGTRIEYTQTNSDGFTVFVLPQGDYHVSYQDHNYLFVVEVNGTQVLANCGTENGHNYAEFLPTCEQVMNTVEFGS
jgi:hypothetical protein